MQLLAQTCTHSQSNTVQLVNRADKKKTDQNLKLLRKLSYTLEKKCIYSLYGSNAYKICSVQSIRSFQQFFQAFLKPRWSVIHRQIQLTQWVLVRFHQTILGLSTKHHMADISILYHRSSIENLNCTAKSRTRVANEKLFIGLQYDINE